MSAQLPAEPVKPVAEAPKTVGGGNAPVSVEKAIEEVKAKAALPPCNYNVVDAYFDFQKLFNAFKKEVEIEVLKDKKKFFGFFLAGVLITISNILVALSGLGIFIPFNSWVTIILSLGLSIGFAYVWGKTRDIVVTKFESDPDKWNSVIKDATMKLTYSK